MFFNYDAWDNKYKKPFGAVKSDTQILFFVETDAADVFLTGFGDKKPMLKCAGGFELSIQSTKGKGLYYYGFEVVVDGQVHHYGKSDDGCTARENGGAYQLTVHNNKPVASWFKGKVMYQIYVDRFYKGSTKDVRLRNNVLMHTSWNEKPVYIKNDRGEVVLWDFFGGNLDGIIKKLDYIKALGVDVIYLNPIFEAISNHKYDTADYAEVDRMYGTTETLTRLTEQAEKQGMKIMLDGVFSHTGEDSIYFNKYKTYGKSGAYNDKKSAYYPWYMFKKHPDEYDSWWGVKALPSVNELNKGFMKYLLDENDGVISKWMKAGVAGWRLDVADELPDEFIKALKTTVLKANPQAVLLGEVWEDASNKVSYNHQREYILGDSLDSVSNYPLRDALIDMLTGKLAAKDFALCLMTLQENYPREIFLSLMNMTGTHDTTRLFTLLGDAPAFESFTPWQAREYVLPQQNIKTATERLMLYFVLLYTLPGNPCIYYGDEICLQGYKDPYNRGTFDWQYKDSTVIAFIKRLSALRDTLNTAEGFVRVIRTDGVLGYQVKNPRKTYTVYINLYHDPVSLPCIKKETPFKYKTKVVDETIKIDAFGACVLV